MKTLQLDDATARKIYPNAAPELKSILEDTFTKQFFSGNVMDRINGFDDICREAGEDPAQYKIPANATKRHRGKILYSMLELIFDVYKQGVVLDYSNSSQKKWYLWLEYKAGSGFRLYGVNFGARLRMSGLAFVSIRKKRSEIFGKNSITFS